MQQYKAIRNSTSQSVFTIHTHTHSYKEKHVHTNTHTHRRPKCKCPADRNLVAGNRFPEPARLCSKGESCLIFSQLAAGAEYACVCVNMSVSVLGVSEIRVAHAVLDSVSAFSTLPAQNRQLLLVFCCLVSFLALASP